MWTSADEYLFIQMYGERSDGKPVEQTKEEEFAAQLAEVETMF